MSRYLSAHADAAAKALKNLFKQPVATLLILLMLAIAMTLPLALYLGVQSSAQVLGKLDEVPQITLYMELSADDVDVQAVAKALADDARIAGAAYVDKKQGLAQLQQNMGGQDLVSVLDENPLPDVFVVMPQPAGPDAVAALRQDLGALPMVESAQMDAEWMQTLYQINTFVHQVFWFLAVTLGLAFVLVAHNTIRLQILSHREEIEITKLLGAPAAFIRRPFLYLAVWQSLLASALSLGLCVWLIQKSQPLVGTIFQPYGVHLQWRFFTPLEIAIVLAVVCSLGIFGAWLATRQHLLRFQARS